MTSSRDIVSRYPELWNCLRRARQRDRLAHAFLVCSDREETRESFAVALARLAACREAGLTGDPCGKCFECRHLENGSYPELHHLSPVGKMYQIQVGERLNPEPNTVRHFAGSFFLTDASGAARKIGIIHDADRMNDEAQNALLKTLEEPPPRTLLILTTGNPSALLPTTRSRCQILRLPELQIDYVFPGSETLFQALRALFYEAGNDIEKAEACAVRIIGVSSLIRENAEESVANEWSPKLREAADFDPAMAKRLEKQRDAAASGAYMRMRGMFLSAIHAFAAETAFLADGVLPEHLPNPELAVLPENGESIDAERAHRMLKNAEELLFNLRFNVNEELAIRDFAFRTALDQEKEG